MSSLQYFGAPAAANADLIYRDYIASLKGADLSVAEIDNVINSGLAGYATIAYVDGTPGPPARGDAANATKAYVDNGDAQRLHLSQKSIANGVCPLDGTGRVPSQRINAPLTQKWVRGPWTPAAYPASQASVTAETTLYTCPVTDPGYLYKLVVFGMMDTRPDRETEYPIINVRVGAANGEIVAQGLGQLDVPDASTMVLGEKFDLAFPSSLNPDTWNQTLVSGGGNGNYYVAAGEAKWDTAGTAAREWRFRRLGPDAVTLTDYQKVRLTIGSRAGEAPFGGIAQWVGARARMNAAETDWVGFRFTDTKFYMEYSVDGNVNDIPASSGGWTTTGSGFSTNSDPGVSYDILAGTVGNLRQFYFYRDDVLIGQAFDGNGVTKADAGHRGWGWGAYCAHRAFDQADPAYVDEVLIADAPPSFGPASIVPYNPHTHVTRSGPTTLYLTGARSGAAATVLYSPYRPRLSVFAVPV